MSQISKIFDERIKSIDKAFENVSASETIHLLLSRGGDLNHYSSSELIEIIDVLNNAVTVTPYVEDMYIYTTNSNRIVTATTVYKNYTQCASIQGRDFLEKNSVEYQIENNISSQYYISPGHFTSVQIISKKHNIALGIKLNKNFVDDILQNINSLNKSNCVILSDQEGIPQLIFGDENIANVYGNSIKHNMQHGIDTDYEIMTVGSQYNNLKYHFIMKSNGFVEVASIGFLNTCMIIFLLIMGIVVCYLLAMRHFLPIKNMATHLTKEMPELIKKNDANEFEIVEYFTNSMISEVNVLKEQISDFLPIIQIKMLKMLLLGQHSVLAEREINYKQYKLQFKYAYFTVILIGIEKKQSKDVIMKTFNIINELESLYIADGVSYCTDMNVNTLAIVVNKDSNDKEWIIQYLQDIRVFFEHTYHFQVTVAASDSCTFDDINNQYNQTLHLLNWHILSCPGITSLLWEQKIDDVPARYYSSEIENKMIMAINSGDVKRVHNYLNTIIIENFVQNNLSLELCKSLFFNLSSVAIRLCTMYGDIFSLQNSNENELYQKIFECNNIAEIEVLLRNLFTEICKYINQKKSTGETMVDRILVHIKENSDDPNISLSSVAELFNLNQNYLSSLLKKRLDVNFLHIVNETRIEKAKKMLEETRLPINEIALKVGFFSDAVFIRNFKNYTQQTPKKYREEIDYKSHL